MGTNHDNAALKRIENDLLQAYNSLVAMRTNPEHTAMNVRAVSVLVSDVSLDLNRYAHHVEKRPYNCMHRQRDDGRDGGRTSCMMSADDCNRHCAED